MKPFPVGADATGFAAHKVAEVWFWLAALDWAGCCTKFKLLIKKVFLSILRSKPGWVVSVGEAPTQHITSRTTRSPRRKRGASAVVLTTEGWRSSRRREDFLKITKKKVLRLTWPAGQLCKTSARLQRRKESEMSTLVLCSQEDQERRGETVGGREKGERKKN